MPQELLNFPTSYLSVGVYRLVTDPKIHRPIWNEFSSIFKRLVISSIIYFCLSYPLTKVWVRFFMRSGSKDRYDHQRSDLSSIDRGILRSLIDSISLVNFTTISLVLGQLSSLLEFFLIRKIKKIRSKVYDLTIQSRSKSNEFWIPYVEESVHPPIDKARRRLAKRRWYKTITNPIFRLIILKVLLLPLSFVPFLNTIVSSFLASLTLSEKLLEPYFDVKRMTELERALFVVERENELRWLGFFAAGLEKIPLLGILFSISNRISFAMFAHDLEKHQHMVKDAIIPRRPESYVSKSTSIESDLPSDAIGNFPKKKSS